MESLSKEGTLGRMRKRISEKEIGGSHVTDSMGK